MLLKASVSPSSRSLPTMRGLFFSSTAEILGIPAIKSLPRNTSISQGDLTRLSINSRRNGTMKKIAKPYMMPSLLILFLSGVKGPPGT